jgi:phospholipase/lecithinase/hemolysin
MPETDSHSPAVLTAFCSRIFRRFRQSICAALAASATLNLVATGVWAGPYSNLVIFGDSLSDVGNIAAATGGIYPGPYYYQKRFSNGPVYADALASGLGLPALSPSTATGSNYAYGGAQTTGTGGFNGFFIHDVDEQVDSYLAAHSPDANALYVVFSGANDFVNGQTNFQIPANSLAEDIDRLITAGARQFLVMNLPLLGYTPRYNSNATIAAEFNARTTSYNAALTAKIDTLEANHPAATFFRLDVAGLFSAAIADPATFGLTNVTQSAAPGLQIAASSYNTSQIVPNQNEYLFWDELHPTTTVHSILADYALDLVVLPGDYNDDLVIDAADYVIWRDALGQTGFAQAADGNGNGTVDATDYNLWRANFGQTASGGTGATAMADAAVPEPASLAILGGCTLVMFWQQRFTR